ncbi:MAG: glycosyltransferase family 4 protein [archaeon]
MSEKSEINVLRVCHHFYSKKNLKIGLAPHFYNLSIQLKELGVNQTVIAGQTDSDNRDVEGIPVYQFQALKPLEIFRSGTAVYNKIKELKENHKLANFDLLHYHNPTYFGLCKHKKKLGVPLIQTIHGSPTRIKELMFSDFTLRNFKEALYFTWLSKIGLDNCDATIVLSNDEKQRLVRLWKIPEEKIFVVPPAVNFNLFKKHQEQKKEFDLIYVGRFSSGKRIPDLLLATANLKSEFPNIKVLLVGAHEKDVDYANVLQDIKKLKLQENVIIKGIVTQKEVNDFHLKSKVFVFPSIHEGFGKALLEAMASELPVIATQCGGPEEIVIENVNGFLVEPKNVFQLTQKIRVLLNDESMQKKLGLNGRKKVEKEFSWERITKLNLEVYKKILGEKND